MQRTEHILRAMRKLGENRLPLTRVYRSLYSEDLLLTAYDKIARNKGALTPGTADDTADGMSMKRVRTVIEQLRCESNVPTGKRKMGRKGHSENRTSQRN